MCRPSPDSNQRQTLRRLIAGWQRGELVREDARTLLGTLRAPGVMVMVVHGEVVGAAAVMVVASEDNAGERRRRRRAGLGFRAAAAGFAARLLPAGLRATACCLSPRTS